MREGLRQSSLATVRRVWAERLGVSTVKLSARAPVLVERPDLSALVVVRLGDTIAVAAPPDALARVRRLPDVRLLDPGALLVLLGPLRPTLIGAASLAFADGATLLPVDPGAVRASSEADASLVLERCTADERDESGLLHMDRRWVALDTRGEPAAISGYEVWGDALAHVGVAVAAGARGHGLAARAVVPALEHALGGGLVPQWRCRRDNLASARVAERLGFVELGEQLAIDLDAADAARSPGQSRAN